MHSDVISFVISLPNKVEYLEKVSRELEKLYQRSLFQAIFTVQSINSRTKFRVTGTLKGCGNKYGSVLFEL